ncbi:maleylpyruvate isomerase family mycothiol-dependent enzyme [Actinomycetospora termitidis]|uniref:Maleylpyruvate isomerase family mycothiol-dependent enzyme n=1 Tax=Actinomycetospora termitidis TaxID=3053470 RepID=A0ABT7M688_9PSEU|nr:maleylpyruvate isomerase family mycothiol-dependent enzyme [Actinomycetospora sp. Odt1-22]MDL5156166.1 maleylpyruvate isomerase family mycothiol-dependent enzyme [Actinomycetospora sp. Odt1-22]
METATKSARSLVGDLGVLRREAGMAMATIASLADDELGRPTRCEGWTRAHVVAHLAQEADVLTGLVTGEAAAPADLEQAVDGATARQLAVRLEQAERRLAAALEGLPHGARTETVTTPCAGELSVYALPALRTAELIVHHHDLDTTWQWHEAGTDAIVDAIEICVLRLQGNPESPGLHVVAREGEEWTVGDGAVRLEGYYEDLLPFLAREQVEDGLRHDGELPVLPPW